MEYFFQCICHKIAFLFDEKKKEKIIADLNLSSFPFSTDYPALAVKRALQPVLAAKVGHTYSILLCQQTKRNE